MNPVEIYWASLASGRRPVVIVSREIFNRGQYVQAVPFTSSNVAKRSQFPNCVPFLTGEFGLPKECMAQCEMLTVIERSFLEESNGLLGVLSGDKFRDLVRALGYVFCAECEPE